MAITKEWIESQKRSLQEQITQLERDLYAKDGAIQALDLTLAELEKPEPAAADAPVETPTE